MPSRKMREALNGFVIRGISQQHPVPGGAAGAPEVRRRRLQHRLHRRALRQGLPRRGRAARRPGLPGRAGGLRAPPRAAARRRHQRPAARAMSVKVGEEFVVVALGAGGRAPHAAGHGARTSRRRSGSSAVADGRQAATRSAATGTWAARASAARSTASPSPRRSSAARARTRWRCASSHNGTRIDALVLSPRAAELHALMPYKAPPDMSRFLLSPMPGLLVDVAVQPGQKVQAGERVAVIEAMKMENVLFATQDGVVGKVLGGQGRVARGRPAHPGVRTDGCQRPAADRDDSPAAEGWLRRKARGRSRRSRRCSTSR